MDEDTTVSGGVTREDVIDALEDLENAEALNTVTEFYEELSAGKSVGDRIKNVVRAAQMIYDAKRYEDTVVWLDMMGTKFSDSDGPDSDVYTAFVEDEDIESLRMKATDKALGDEEEEMDDFEDDDE